MHKGDDESSEGGGSTVSGSTASKAQRGTGIRMSRIQRSTISDDMSEDLTSLAADMGE